VVVAVVGLLAGAAGQTDVSKLGPQVGAKAIDFDLRDQFDRSQTLATLAGTKGTMLVFFRSADW
jgi:hypothetical protein